MIKINKIRSSINSIKYGFFTQSGFKEIRVLRIPIEIDLVLLKFPIC